MGLKILKSVIKDLKFKTAILVILGFLSGIFESLGIGVLVPLFSVIVNKEFAAQDRTTAILGGFLKMFGADLRVRWLILMIIAAFVMKAVVMMLFSFVRIKIISDYEFKMRSRLMSNILLSKWRYLMNKKIGYIENVLMNDINNSVLFLTHTASFVLATTSLIVYIFFAFRISWIITSISLLVGLAVAFFYKPLIAKTRVLASRVSALNKQIAHFVNESTLGFKALKSFGAESQAAIKICGKFDELKNKRILMQMFFDFAGIAMQPVSIILITIIFGFVYSKGGFDFGTFVAVMYFVYRIFIYLERDFSLAHRINEKAPFIKNVFALNEEAENNKENTTGGVPFSFKKDIEFNGVSFSYGGLPILKNVSFGIERGSAVGIIGPSGVGKTTLADLLLRLFDDYHGKITLDGIDIMEFDRNEWKKNVAYVSQDIFLLNDTIENNIKFYGQAITDEKMIEAAKMANIYDFIVSLPKGFKSNVGERGTLLSVGQRQRIVLARALTRQPEILVLDEATSALDNESEAAIKKTLEELKGKMTIITIAHRLSTIMEADQLIILEEGAVAELGSPQELLKNKESYLYRVHNIEK